ncbi:MAG: hypothetical protein KAT62_10060 [Desulfuromonadales bacterium]|nr:hypothetical protein [Desulfuromonadales bacterium]
MENKFIDYFGFLPVPGEIEFSHGVVTPLPEIRDIVREVRKQACRDGYIYPPLLKNVETISADDSRKSCDLDHPASYLHLPATHSLTLSLSQKSEQEPRYGLAGFIAHFLGFLFGYRVQFYDWRFEGRVNVKSSSTHTPPHLEQVTCFLESGIKVWSNWGLRKKTIAINALYLHARTSLYENDWERFQVEYQTIDAVCYLAKVANYSHNQRLKKLCEKHSIPVDEEKFKSIIGLRNELLHEAIWDGRMPGEVRSQISMDASSWLHKISKRAILATFGVRGRYIESNWWKRWPESFEI